MTDLAWSVKNGDLNGVQEIMEKQNQDVNAEISGRCPIHYAADYGQIEIIKYLVTKGADLNRLDKHGICALLAATWEGHAECVKYLISQGADKQIKAPDGRHLFECADSEEMKTLLK
ncbi:myotrophin [Octopus bimaculoides]|uniref:Uncharacterized protein n=1 Tax=Octopus bimaculoides TaxID=37653 RepID=A0A0L8GYM1_OCTBM|nr:myotrophin [Octopus bimaculoides]|eukprot:XP_014777230.1 PREDICTED: myotrophin-like [Octopus bimaculoides]